MKRTFSIIIFLILNLTGFSQNSDYYYYYYKSKKVNLHELNSKNFILTTNGKSEKDIKSDLAKDNFILEKFKPNKIKSFFSKTNRNIQESNWGIVKGNIALKKFDWIIYEAPFYITEDNEEVGLSHLFYVKLKKEKDSIVLNEISKGKNVEIIGQNEYMPLWFTLSCSNKSDGNALEMANYFYETGLFEASEPDFLIDNLMHNPNYPNQWGLNNTGQNGGTTGIDINAPDAWNITTGQQNVVVAVIDQGIELNHPDLLNVSPISFDTESSTSPSQVLGSHGTACAGIVGASDNQIGGVGVAPGCTLMSISNELVLDINVKQQLANGINFAWQNGASVISNSWGHNSLQSTLIDNAITAAINQGRNGLGCIVVFSSGNDDDDVTYPANSNPEILAVGAISQCGERKSPTSCDTENEWGSNFGNELDIVAPGVLVPTTDRQGNNGYNPLVPIHTLNGGTLINTDYANQDYTRWFNGTSSAAPHVSAVAALILSVNPNLTGEEVRNIIESTAQKVGGYNYKNHTNRQNGTWNNEMGYGLLDAYAAVQMALPSPLSNVNQICFGTNTTINLNNSQNLPVAWEVSYNVTKVSSNNTSIIVRSKYANSTSTGWVRATLNGIEYTETFGVNGSENEIPMSVTVSLANNYLTITIHDGSGNTPYYLYLNNVYKLSTTSRTITVPYYQNSGRVEIRNKNSCETGWNYAYYTGYFGGSYNYSYNVFPNPASESLTLERVDSTLDNPKNSNFDLNKNNRYELYDFYENLVSKGQISNLTKLDVSNFKAGRYILLIITDENYESHNIIIN